MKTIEKETMEQKQPGEIMLELPAKISGILSSLIIITLPTLLGMSNLTIWQFISLASFAIALPCLGGYTLIMYEIQAYKVDPQAKGKTFLFLQYAGLITAIIGIGAIVTNSSWIAGLISALCIIIAIFVCGQTLTHIAEIYTKRYGKNPT